MELVIVPRTVDIGGFKVHRALPVTEMRMVGPFIFWDQMGPGEFASGHGIDVRPHPHIGLSTVTYLFNGNMDHKDSLGNNIRIVPGDVNFMSAGKGIVHSERTGQDVRQNPSRLFGIQSWLAQSKNAENGAPEFTHIKAAEIPSFKTDTLSGTIVIGEYQGYRSPVRTEWNTLYLELKIVQSGSFAVSGATEERAIYLVSGKIEIEGATYRSRQMIVLRPNSEVLLKARGNVHLLLIGGDAMDGPRYIWWNFVSSSIEQIKSAADDWRNNKFKKVPGDLKEYIPLPSLPFPEE